MRRYLGKRLALYVGLLVGVWVTAMALGLLVVAGPEGQGSLAPATDAPAPEVTGPQREAVAPAPVGPGARQVGTVSPGRRYPAGRTAAVLPPPPGTPEPTVFPTPRPEELVTREDLPDLEARGLVTRTVVSGPSTKGAAITVAGKRIKLPDDMYIEAKWLGGICPVGWECPAYPTYVLVRGNSSTEIDSQGKVWWEEVAPGEEGAFDFLREALAWPGPYHPPEARLLATPQPPRWPPQPPWWWLPKPGEGEFIPKPLPSGPRTRGALLEIGGRQIRLPDDAYVYLGFEFVCPEGWSCPESPVYMLVRRTASIWVDGAGNTWKEYFYPADRDAFDFLKEALQ